MLIPQARAHHLLAAEDLAGIVVASAPAVFYFTGLSKGPAIAVAGVDRLAAPALAIPVELTDFTLRCLPGVDPIITYGRFIRFRSTAPSSGLDARMIALSLDQAPLASLLDAFSAALEARGLGRGRLGYEESSINAALLEEMAKRHPQITWIPASSVLRKIRMVKSPEEVLRIRRAAEVTEQAMREAASAAREGLLVREMAAAFDLAQIKLGAVPRGNHTSFGGATAYGMVNLDEQRLTRGDLIRFDAGCTVEGYSSDLARNFAFGPVPERARVVYRIMAEALANELALVRPGVEARKVFTQTVARIKHEIPWFERLHVGHGLGLTGVGYDAPLIGPDDVTPFEEGMVLCLETPYYELGLGGLQPEDMVVVTATGCNRLNPACPVELPEAV